MEESLKEKAVGVLRLPLEFAERISGDTVADLLPTHDMIYISSKLIANHLSIHISN